MLDGGGAAKIKCQRGLTHRRTRRDNDHLPASQTTGHSIKVDESGGDAGDLTLVKFDLFELGEDVFGHLGHRHIVGLRLAFCDGEDLRLGFVDDFIDIAASVRVTELDDSRARSDEATQDRALFHDSRVVARVCCGRNRCDQAVDVRGPADPGQIALPLEFANDCHCVRGFAPAHEVDDRVVNDFVDRLVVVASTNFFADIGDCFFGEHHGTQDGHLCVDVLGWGAIEVFRCHV